MHWRINADGMVAGGVSVGLLFVMVRSRGAIPQSSPQAAGTTPSTLVNCGLRLGNDGPSEAHFQFQI